MSKPPRRSSIFGGIRCGIRKDPLQGISIKYAKRTLGVAKSPRDPRGIRQDPPILSSLPCLKTDKMHHRGHQISAGSGRIRQCSRRCHVLRWTKSTGGHQISAGSARNPAGSGRIRQCFRRRHVLRWTKCTTGVPNQRGIRAGSGRIRHMARIARAR